MFWNARPSAFVSFPWPNLIHPLAPKGVCLPSTYSYGLSLVYSAASLDICTLKPHRLTGASPAMEQDCQRGLHFRASDLLEHFQAWTMTLEKSIMPFTHMYSKDLKQNHNWLWPYEPVEEKEGWGEGKEAKRINVHCFKVHLPFK